MGRHRKVTRHDLLLEGELTGQVVKLTWMDSCHSEGLTFKELAKQRPLTVVTYGQVIEDNDQYLVLAMTIDQEDKEVVAREGASIIRNNIKEVTILREV